MSSSRVCSAVVLALVACACLASAGRIGQAQTPDQKPSVTMDVVYGHKDGLALTLDVHRPARSNGAAIISIVSGGFQSSVEMAQIFSQAYPPMTDKGFTVFAVRHGSFPRYPLSSIVADREAIRPLHPPAGEGVQRRSQSGTDDPAGLQFHSPATLQLVCARQSGMAPSRVRVARSEEPVLRWMPRLGDSPENAISRKKLFRYRGWTQRP